VKLRRPALASCAPCCCRGSGSAAQAMAARITELVNATLRAEAGPETQLTEAQVHAKRSAMPHQCQLCHSEQQTDAGTSRSAMVTGQLHRNRGLNPHVLPTVQVLDLIDQGGSEGGAAGRHWVLDPIDGTRGFVGLRQYAICLGMLQDGKVSVLEYRILNGSQCLCGGRVQDGTSPRLPWRAGVRLLQFGKLTACPAVE
jgi:Inositol monophosphatase family